jgi:RNA polymerase sigma factor (sigma-70 family)
MWSRPEIDEALIRQILPSSNPDRHARASAWAEWQATVGDAALRKFIQANNYTAEPDEDILQETMLTAYLEVERGSYQLRTGIPFTAYVKGIARNKIREARRRQVIWLPLEEIHLPMGVQRQLEIQMEYREEHRTLHRGLEHLTVLRRQVLEGVLNGESTAEIAAGLAMSKDLVRQHKSRALRSLRRSLRQTAGSAQEDDLRFVE